MSLKEQVTQDLKAAMRAKDTIALDAIRAIRGEILKMEKGGIEGEVTDELIIKSLKTLIKERVELADTARKAERPDIFEEQDSVVAVLKTYLPEALSSDELAAIVEAAVVQVGAETMKDMGKVMGSCKKAVQQSGKDADNRELSELIKKRLS